uniref:G-protein coupled receptors family 1 profile domain-containing protein n=1 Tax=Acrobeloides nanus TaxID=290746 RepID=A0A914DU55_9BILA
MSDEEFYELQPTILPEQCNATENLDRVAYLAQHAIINWPNFTQCLPNCGLCTSFTSEPTYMVFNLLVIGILLPFISLCGLFGNAISAFVYSRRAMRSSTNSYLCALGCSDNAVICTAIFVFFIDSIRRYSLRLSIIYGIFAPVVYPAGMIAQTSSVYFTLSAALDCFVQVCLPERFHRFCSKISIAKITILSVLIFSVLYNVPHFFEAVVLECWHAQFLSRSLEVCPTPLRFEPTYQQIYYKYMYSIFLAIGPLVFLVILNVFIIGASLLKSKNGSSNGDNMALILVVLLFIKCNMVALILNIFENRLQEILGWKMNYVVDISNLLVVFNSSFNFVIYYKFSAPFRHTLCQYFATGDSKNDSKDSSPTKCIVKVSTDGQKASISSYANGNAERSVSTYFEYLDPRCPIVQQM